MKLFHFALYLLFIFIALISSYKAKAENSSRNVPSLLKKATEIKISNLSEPNEFFTGRKREINKIAEVLFKGKENILVVEGITGIGKTQLAKKYAYSYLGKYELIWWFDSERNLETQIDNLLKEIHLRNNKPYYRPTRLTDLIKKLRQELTVLGLNWLIIFDNFDEMSVVNQCIPFKNNDLLLKHIIVTSKKMNSAYPSLIIHKFQRKESISFLAKILKEENEDNLNALAETLEDFPLALAQAASYIKMNSSVSITTYLKLFKESLSELWKSEQKILEGKKFKRPLDDNYNKTISTAIIINIDSIKTFSPLAYKILTFCSLLNHQHISLDTLEQWACDKHGATKIEFHEALSLLLNYFLLEEEKSQREKQDSKHFSQHELIQLITVNAIDTDTRKILLKEAAECLIGTLLNVPGTLQEQFKGKKFIYNHIEKVCNLAEELNYKDPKIDELKIALLYFVHLIQRDFTRGSHLIKKLSKELLQKSNAMGSLAQLWFHSILVNDQMYEELSKVQEDYGKALMCLEKIQDIETKRSYLIHLGVDYAHSLSNFGKLKEAIALCDNLKETVEKTKNESQKVAFLGTSALLRLKYGQYEQCLKDINSSLELMADHKDLKQDIPWSMLIKAHCLLYQGYIQEAYQIIEKCYPLLRDIFTTPENTIMVNARLVKGACLASLGKLEEALRIVQETMAPYEKTAGYENDSLKGMGYCILGEIFEVKGDLSKAYEEYIKAEKFYDRILQGKTLDDLSRLYTRLAILGAKQGDDLMVDKYLSLHIEHFGLAHPRTREIKSYLDQKNLPLP